MEMGKERWSRRVILRLRAQPRSKDIFQLMPHYSDTVRLPSFESMQEETRRVIEQRQRRFCCEVDERRTCSVTPHRTESALCSRGPLGGGASQGGCAVLKRVPLWESAKIRARHKLRTSARRSIHLVLRDAIGFVGKTVACVVDVKGGRRKLMVFARRVS